MPRRTYRIAPAFKWPAKKGPVRLGAIITSPDEPNRPLDGPDIELPQEQYEVHQQDVSVVIVKESELAARLFAKILKAAGVGLGGSSYDSQLQTLQTKHLETKSFGPSDAYVEQRLKHPEVQRYLTSKRRKVYMITGLKIAYSPSGRDFESASKSLDIDANADVSASGVPLGVGIKAGHKVSSLRDTTFEGGSAVIFAYELREIKYGIINKAFQTKDVTKGAVMGLDGEDQEADDAGEKLEAYNKGLKDDDEPTKLPIEGVADEDFILPLDRKRTGSFR